MVRELPPDEVLRAWPQPDFTDPARFSDGVALPVIAIFFCVLAYIVVGLRLYVRAYLLRSFGLDDWCMTVCLIPALALAVVSCIAGNYGWGYHEWDQHEGWYSPSELISWIIQLMYILNMFFTKMALLISYLRFSRPGKFQIAVYVTMGIVVGWMIASTLTTIFACWPVSGYWNQRHYEHCPINDDARLLSIVLINIFTDFVVCLMPIKIIWDVKIARREKVVLYILLTLGLVASIASIIRTIVMDRAITTYDITWHGYSVWIWTCIECDLAIICASVPCLRPLSKKFFFFLKSAATSQVGSLSHQLDTLGRKNTVVEQSVAVEGKGRGVERGQRMGVVTTIRASSEESLV